MTIKQVLITYEVIIVTFVSGVIETLITKDED